MKRILPLTLVILSLMLSPSCTSFNPGVHFILPDGYTGSFRIVLDETQGVDVKLEGDRYIYRIPEAGELKVKSFQPLMTWHKLTATYRSGKEIPYADSTVKPDAIALRSGPGSGSREIEGKNVGPIILFYVIGTQEQVNSVETPVFTDKVQNANSGLKP